MWDLSGFVSLIPSLSFLIGETHSVCCTVDGDVWTWGSNSHGQLGVRLFHTENKLGGQGTCSPVRVKLLHSDIVSSNEQTIHLSDQMDDELLIGAFLEPEDHPTPNRFSILQVCASRSSTIVIIKKVRSSVSEVYQWGYGSHTPTKLYFHRPVNNLSMELSSSWSETRVQANITQVSAGYNHFVAIDKFTGYVYTWGFGAVQLGHGTSETSTHLSTPQLLESLLPKSGGNFYFLLKSEYVQVGGQFL